MRIKDMMTENYYFSTELITVEGDTDEVTFEIFSALARNAKDLYVINDGINKMFVKTYTDIKDSNNKLWQAFKRGEIDEGRFLSQIKIIKNFIPTEERWIYPGQIRCFHNVFKILIGKTHIGNQYRITEFKPYEIQA